MPILIKFDSRGSVFFAQNRVGRDGRIFKIFKFRSMVANAENLKKNLQKKSHRDGPLFKIKNDPRITRFGKFLRRFSLDEVPQIFNILRGEMSFVGPRPHLPTEIEKFSAHEKKILKAKPGLSGLAQISGRSDLPFSREISLDLKYIENWNLILDLQILVKSFFVIFRKTGAD